MKSMTNIEKFVATLAACLIVFAGALAERGVGTFTWFLACGVFLLFSLLVRQADDKR